MKKFVWLLVGCLVVLSLVLASCAPATPTTPTTPTTPITPSAPATTPTAPATEKPMYGGTVIIGTDKDTLGWDIDQQDVGEYGPGIANEDLLTGDWAKGPAGTGETKWELRTMLLDIYTGYLATSWSIPDANTIIYKIRPGVHFMLDSSSEASRLVNGRELTAEDVAYNIQREIGNPKTYYGASYPGYLKSVEATDKYTVVVHGNDTELTRTARAFEDISGSCRIYPREVIEKYGDMRNWKNSVGSGPFYVTDYVGGSSMSFKKNPGYWRTDPVGPGKGNQLPYLDGVKILVIPDVSTRIAALRTGKVDWVTSIALDDERVLHQQKPEIVEAAHLDEQGGGYIAGRIDRNLPFDDVRVRRAMMMAVDQQAVARDFYKGQAAVLWFPTAPAYPSLYTPIEQLPESTKTLYTYDPAKAKALLAEAGYPNGFKTEVVLPNTTDIPDKMAIYKSYLGAVGIDMEMKIYDNATWMSIRIGKTHNAMMYGRPAFDNPYKITHAEPGNSVNNVGIDDPVINAASAAIWDYKNIENPTERANQVKIRTLRVLDQAYFLTFPAPYAYRMWWPWLKNYHGELNVRYWDPYSWVPFVWIDQGLKKSMGY